MKAGKFEAHVDMTVTGFGLMTLVAEGSSRAELIEALQKGVEELVCHLIAPDEVVSNEESNHE